MPVYGYKDLLVAEASKRFTLEQLANPRQGFKLDIPQPDTTYLRQYWFKPDNPIDGATFDSGNNKYILGTGVGVIWVRKKISTELSSQEIDNTLTGKDLIQLLDDKGDPVKRRAFNMSPAKVANNWPVPVWQDNYGDLYIDNPQLFLGKTNGAINKTVTNGVVHRYKGTDRSDANFDDGSICNQFANIADNKWVIYGVADGGLYLVAGECPLTP